MRALVSLFAVTACSSPSPCDVTVLGGSGSVARAMTSMSAGAPVVLADGTVACGVCDALFELAPAGTSAHRVKLAAFNTYSAITAGTGDDLYFFDTNGNLEHVSTAGEVLW